LLEVKKILVGNLCFEIKIKIYSFNPGKRMIFNKTRLEGAYIVEMEKHEDERGFFSRSWCKNEFEDHGLNSRLVQANIGFSLKRGTLRGLHYQMPPYEEVKVVRCTMGAIYDVIVDLRPDSQTYKQWLSVELNCDNRKMLYVPEGFAQGYITLIDNTEMYYHTSQFYAPKSARGIRYDDPSFSIDWPIKVAVISEADKNWPNYEDNKHGQ
jgi:dTDP-4-dehydrorhamnose 3,5-epimerase